MNITVNKPYVALPITQVFTRAGWAKDPALAHSLVLLPRQASLKEHDVRKMRRDNLERVIAIAVEELRTSLRSTKDERRRAALTKRILRLQKLDLKKLPLPQSFLLSYTDTRFTRLARRTDERELKYVETSHETIRIPLRIFRLGLSLRTTLSIVKGNTLELLEEEVEA